MSLVMAVSAFEGYIIKIPENYLLQSFRVFMQMNYIAMLQFQPLYKRVNVEIQVNFG